MILYISAKKSCSSVESMEVDAMNLGKPVGVTDSQKKMV
jgi:hypothetical protein